VSEEDAAIFRRMAKEASRVCIAPNGVSVERFDLRCPSPLREQMGTRPLLCYFGTTTYGPNKEVADYVLGELAPRFLGHPKRPVFVLSGSHEQPAGWLAENVYAIGKVPRIEPYVAGADAIIVPLKQTHGTHLKLVEALGAGQAILTTPEGAAGLGLRDGFDCLVRPREEFAAGLESLLEMLPAEALREHARRTGRRFDWKVIGETVRDNTFRVLQEKRSR